jgi:hypothetical protein
MKRVAFSICIAIASLGLGACEKHSSDTLPEHYLHKWDAKHSDAGHDSKAPGHEEKAGTPDAAHKG